MSGVNTKLVEDKRAMYLKEITVSLTGFKTSHTTKSQRYARERYLAVILLCTEDNGRAGGRLLHELKNNALKGQSAFPATLAKALVVVND